MATINPLPENGVVLTDDEQLVYVPWIVGSYIRNEVLPDEQYALSDDAYAMLQELVQRFALHLVERAEAEASALGLDLQEIEMRVVSGR